MRIVEAQIEDQAELRELIYISKKSNGYSKAEMAKFASVIGVPKRVFEKYLVYKVVENGKIVAVLVIKNMKIRCVLEDLFVSPKMQGKGIGRKLVEFTEKKAKSLGYTTLFLQRDPHSEDFYKKLGYHTYGYFKSKVVPGRTLPMMKKIML